MSCYLAICPKCGFIRLGNFSDEDFNDDSSGKSCFHCKTPYINTDVVVNDYFNAFYDDDFEMMDLIEEKMNHQYVFNSLEYDEMAFAERQREVAIERHKVAKKTENSDQVKCPKCGSTQIQLVSKKWSVLTGFMTNKVDRVCVNCKRKF